MRAFGTGAASIALVLLSAIAEVDAFGYETPTDLLFPLVPHDDDQDSTNAYSRKLQGIPSATLVGEGDVDVYIQAGYFVFDSSTGDGLDSDCNCTESEELGGCVVDFQLHVGGECVNAPEELGGAFKYEATEDGTICRNVYSDKDCNFLVRSCVTTLPIDECSEGAQTAVQLSNWCIRASEPQGVFAVPMVLQKIYMNLTECEVDGSDYLGAWAAADADSCLYTHVGIPEEDARGPGGIQFSCQDGNQMSIAGFRDRSCSTLAGELLASPGSCTPDRVPNRFRSADCGSTTIYCQSMNVSGFANPIGMDPSTIGTNSTSPPNTMVPNTIAPVIAPTNLASPSTMSPTTKAPSTSLVGEGDVDLYIRANYVVFDSLTNATRDPDCNCAESEEIGGCVVNPLVYIEGECVNVPDRLGAFKIEANENGTICQNVYSDDDCNFLVISCINTIPIDECFEGAQTTVQLSNW